MCVFLLVCLSLLSWLLFGARMSLVRSHCQTCLLGSLCLSLLIWLLFGVWMSLGKVPLSDLSPWIYVCLSVGLSLSALQAAVWGLDVPG